jgi:hypothetical protein
MQMLLLVQTGPWHYRALQSPPLMAGGSCGKKTQGAGLDAGGAYDALLCFESALGHNYGFYVIT